MVGYERVIRPTRNCALQVRLGVCESRAFTRWRPCTAGTASFYLFNAVASSLAAKLAAGRFKLTVVCANAPCALVAAHVGLLAA